MFYSWWVQQLANALLRLDCAALRQVSLAGAARAYLPLYACTYSEPTYLRKYKRITFVYSSRVQPLELVQQCRRWRKVSTGLEVCRAAASGHAHRGGGRNALTLRGGGGGGGGGHALCGSHLHFPDLPQSASTWRSTLHPCPTRSARLRSCGRCHITSLLPPCVTAPSPPCSPPELQGQCRSGRQVFLPQEGPPP